MRFVSVPDLAVAESEQRYEPLCDRRLRFTSGNFTARMAFDEDGLVERYEGLAERLR